MRAAYALAECRQTFRQTLLAEQQQFLGDACAQLDEGLALGLLPPEAGGEVINAAAGAARAEAVPGAVLVELEAVVAVVVKRSVDFAGAVG